MRREFTATDRGKQIKTADGEVLGTITGIGQGRAHVRPVATVATGVASGFQWTDDEEIILVDSDDVDTIDNAEAHLKDGV